MAAVVKLSDKARLARASAARTQLKFWISTPRMSRKMGSLGRVFAQAFADREGGK